MKKTKTYDKLLEKIEENRGDFEYRNERTRNITVDTYVYEKDGFLISLSESYRAGSYDLKGSTTYKLSVKRLEDNYTVIKMQDNEDSKIRDLYKIVNAATNKKLKNIKKSRKRNALRELNTLLDKI